MDEVILISCSNTSLQVTGTSLISTQYIYEWLTGYHGHRDGIKWQISRGLYEYSDLWQCFGLLECGLYFKEIRRFGEDLFFPTLWWNLWHFVAKMLSEFVELNINSLY